MTGPARAWEGDLDHDEIELKLALEPRELERLRRSPLLRAHRQGRATPKRLCSTYYDTPALDLAKAGITVRVRLAGRHHVQTVKTAGSRIAGLFARREWEAPLPAPTPDRGLLRATGLPPLMAEDVLERLAPVFFTDIRRSVHLLAGPGWRVELALDQGEVGAGDRREPVSEVELELREGSAADLFALAGRIAGAVPVRLTALAKSDRGYALAAGAAPAPVKARPVPVTPDMGVAEAFQAIARNCLHHLLANERSLLATGDGEAVHQMRVALRRLRSAIRVFRPVVDGPQLAAIRDHLAWLLEHLGPARDTDVFLAEIVDPVVRRYPGNPALAGLRRQWLDNRDDRMEAAMAAVAGRRFTAMLLALGEWVEAGDWLGLPDRPQRTGALAPFAAAVLTRCDRRTNKAGGRRLARLEAADLHKVRIRGKQMRYAAEFFAPLFPRKATRAFLAILADLQDSLGQINDIAVAAPRLAGDQPDGDRAWAAGLVAGWHEARRPALMEAAEAAWKRYRKAERFWTGKTGAKP